MLPPPKPGLGTTLGPYRIERRLAAGGMAEIFVAQKLGPHGFAKRVALKRILPQHARDPEFVGMFVDEARLAAQLEHPNIVPVFDFGEHGGSLFMAMELVEGTTVGRLLRTIASHGAGQAESVPLGAALHVAHQAAAALAYAHALRDERGRPLNVVHRDVSPANLLLDRQGHVKLTDFGIARCRTSDPRTDDGHIRGKLGYMSPEQVVGDPVDGKSDVFTLGIVLGELLIAEPLFGTGADLEVLLSIRNVDLSTLRDKGAHLPSDVMRLLRWALEREAEARASAREFEAALRGILARRRELGRGAHELARLLERLSLVQRRPDDERAPEAGAQPTFLVELDEKSAPPHDVKRLLERLAESPPTTYELRGPSGQLQGPVAYSEMVRRIVTGELDRGTKVRKDRGDFESAFNMPELARYLDSRALCTSPAGPPEGATRRGVLYGARLLAQAHQLTAGRETGGLYLWDGARQKRIFYVDGRPEFISSNSADELLGEFLVARGTVLRMELDMALAMLDRYDGRLGDALIGLGMLRPMQLFRAVRDQVRARYLEAFRWDRGQWAYVEGALADAEDTFPLGVAEHELLRDAALQPTEAHLEAALHVVRGRRLGAHPEPPAPMSSYRLPPEWEALLVRADGRTTLDGLMAGEHQRGGLSPVEVRRAVFLGLSCELLQAA